MPNTYTSDADPFNQVESYKYLMGQAQPSHLGSQSESPSKEDIPTPKEDPRGYDSNSNPRNYQKYPASFPEKMMGLLGVLSGK